MRSNLEIAQSIALSVYEMQVESEFFLDIESKIGEKIPEQFTQKILSTDGHAEVMKLKMASSILSHITTDDTYLEYHKDVDGVIGYIPDDRVYDFQMTNYIIEMYDNPMVREEIIEEIKESIPMNKYKVTAKFVTYGTIEVEAASYEEAEELAENIDEGDYITDDENGEFTTEVEEL